MYQPVLTRNNGMRGMFAGDVENNIRQRLTGTGSPNYDAKFRQMDDATARAGANLTSATAQGVASHGQFGQGAGRSAFIQAQRQNMEQAAQNKLEQAKLLGADKMQATTEALAYDNNDLDRRLRAQQQAFDQAERVGSGTMMGGLLDQSVGTAGYDVTGYGRQSAGDEAAYAKTERDLARRREEAYANRRMRSGGGWQGALAGALKGGMAGAMTGNPYIALGGAAAGGAGGYFA